MTAAIRHDITVEEALARLRPFQETVDPCKHGHIDHDASGHVGRRLIHSTSPRGFGADWNEEDVVVFIRAAERVVDVGGSHPLAVFSGGRWMKFEGATE